VVECNQLEFAFLVHSPLEEEAVVAEACTSLAAHNLSAYHPLSRSPHIDKRMELR
jgi:hypothetical protein